MNITSVSPKVMKAFGSAAMMLTMLILLSGCVKDSCETTMTYLVYDPVIKTLEEVRSEFKVEAPRGLTKTGKIYIYNQYLLVSEPEQGLHVIDNSNPSHPVPISFVRIPGNKDMAVKNNVLYADNYMDLLVLDISNPADIVLKGRKEFAMPGNFSKTTDGKYVVGYTAREVTEVYPSDCDGGNMWRGGGATTMMDSEISAQGGNKSSGGPNKGGSMARFTIYKDYLYIVSTSSLIPYNIAVPSAPEKLAEVKIGWGIETIYPYNDNLFIGSTDGMFIYGLENPAQPVKKSAFSHVRSCDPVVVEGNIAYVTLRSGTPCEGFTNQLEVLDVTDLNNPKLLKTYQMTNPHGLGIDNGTLFICDGADGLKVYDATEAEKLDKIGHYEGMETYDVIPYGNNLILSSKDGIYQYSYADPKNLVLLSKIALH
ncbi:MAG: hypothetical protein M3Q97_06075 [Bacteroidota bacterium]|nr:hypothetical protein [Bacteroidota bacterium]